MIFSPRKDSPHHSTIYWAISLLCLGLGINVTLTLIEGNDIGFFSANTLFSATTMLVVATGLVGNLTKNFDFFLFFGILACFNLIFSLQPIVMYADEGNLCSGLSSADQATGRACYTAAVGAVNSDGGTSSFDNLIDLVTTCYSNNDILSRASGVCYNIRWGKSSGQTIRNFMLISWLAQFFGTLMAITCAAIEIIKFGNLKKLYCQIDYYNERCVLQFFRDFNCASEFSQYSKLLADIKNMEQSKDD
jgi:hypothetical protein